MIFAVRKNGGCGRSIYWPGSRKCAALNNSTKALHKCWNNSTSSVLQAPPPLHPQGLQSVEPNVVPRHAERAVGFLIPPGLSLSRCLW